MFLFCRQKLFLTVQSEVLPRYGYEGSSNGVYKMMGDMKPYIKDSLCSKPGTTSTLEPIHDETVCAPFKIDEYNGR